MNTSINADFQEKKLSFCLSISTMLSRLEAKSLCIVLVVSGPILFLVYTLLTNQSYCPSSKFFTPSQSNFSSPPPPQERNLFSPPPTNISHLVFGLVGSLKAWSHRKAYIESWWRPNVTQGYLFLDESPADDLLNDLLPWSKASPPLRVSDDISKIVNESNHAAPIMVRMVHAIMETFREVNEGVRWIVMGDDDSIFFVDNWVSVLGKYDHNEYVYIGGHSETIMSNFYYSFDQGFGGAGFALSYPLAKAMSKDLEGCIKRYPRLNSADLITKFCVDEVGASFSPERGIHQIDLHGDISGFLSSHPQSPLLSLHHFDVVDPIFPSMDRYQSTNHLMEAAKTDQSRMLQQTICYHKPTNWSFSISWGYSAHIYENVVPRTDLKKPLETFEPWIPSPPPNYIFNTRGSPFADPCFAPHVFFFKSARKFGKDQIVTEYVRSSPRGIGTCLPTGDHSAEFISKVRVLSPAGKLIKYVRSECCDVVSAGHRHVAEVKYRACKENEIIA